MLKRKSTPQKKSKSDSLKIEIKSEIQEEIKKENIKLQQEEREYDFINYFINRYSMFLN